MKILLVSHGEIAQGFCSTLRNFFGMQEVYYANVSLETGTTGLIEKAESYLNEWKDEQVVICSDLKGGSANQTICRYLSRENTFIVSGMNLMLMLQLAVTEHVTEEELRRFVENARTDLSVIDGIASEFSEDDE